VLVVYGRRKDVRAAKLHHRRPEFVPRLQAAHGALEGGHIHRPQMRISNQPLLTMTMKTTWGVEAIMALSPQD
jgi:hypothetical protein